MSQSDYNEDIQPPEVTEEEIRREEEAWLRSRISYRASLHNGPTGHGDICYSDADEGF